MNLEKIKSTYIRVAELTMSQRQRLVSFIDASGVEIDSHSKGSIIDPKDTNEFGYLYYDCKDVNKTRFVRFRCVLQDQSHLSVVTFEEYASYFSLGVELQHNKTKFIIV